MGMCPDETERRPLEGLNSLDILRRRRGTGFVLTDTCVPLMDGL
jgi:hypothetical protein